MRLNVEPVARSVVRPQSRLQLHPPGVPAAEALLNRDDLGPLPPPAGEAR
ncbi:hypothetical protein [Frankia sp. AgKG'84/4]|nr:hypothetical protein [Frankia sp. AgKG'84/4]MCL9792772.1 hypothetical protein [Frankia sp. AgKG'84/4]